jgi:hypothetical protein
MSVFEEVKKKLSYAASPEGLKEATEFLGLPSGEEIQKRQAEGKQVLNPLEVMGVVGRPIESVTAAPARAAISSLQGNLDLGEAMKAFANQFGRNPSLSPTGGDIAEKAGLQGKAAAAAGLGLDIAIDPMNLMGTAALKALPLIGLAGTVAKAEKAQALSKVLAAKDELGFYSKLEQVILEKMGKSATPEQVMSIAKGAKEEEVAASGLEQLLNGKDKVSKDEVLQQIRSQRPQLEEVIKGGAKVGIDSTSPYYQLPEVRRIVESEQGAAGIEISLANDGDAYRALSKKFPDVMNKENWEQIIVQDVLSKARNKQFQPTKFQQYVEPGGENYREVLVTLPPRNTVTLTNENVTRITDSAVDPNKFWTFEAPDPLYGRQVYKLPKTIYPTEEAAKAYIIETKQPRPNNFQSSHWDEPNVLAHARVNERVDEAGNALFHVEEIQSDWHQMGRERGYQVDEMPKGSSSVKRSGVPDAPFKKSWMEMTAKRMVTQAVESGANRLSWTPGAKQAERYDLSKQISRIEYEPYGANIKGESLYEVTVYDKNGNQIYYGEDLGPTDLEGIVGKEMTDKIISKEGRSIKQEDPYGRDLMALEGLDLKVGGEGMKGFYDKMLPDFLRKLGKKYGAQVGETTTNGMKVPFLELTPELKKAVKEEGLPLFKVGISAGLPALMEKMRRDKEQSERR